MRHRIKKYFVITALCLVSTACASDKKIYDEILKNQPYGQFYQQDISDIAPEGWLKTWMNKQAKGLCGNIEASGYPYNTQGWADYELKFRNGEAWWPFEQTGYWVDGALRCGYLSKDEALRDRALKQVNYVLTHASEDGYIGPPQLRTGSDIHNNYWPFAVFFRAVMAHYDVTKDPAILDALTKHFMATSDKYASGRNALNIETIVWLYARTGNPAVLKTAQSAFEKAMCWEDKLSNPYIDGSVIGMLSDVPPLTHGVSYNEGWKIPVIVYSVTGNEKYLKASINAVRKMDKFHMLASGAPSCEEFLRGKDELAMTETCNVSDYTWSLGYLLMATGQAEWADKIEKAVFNAGMGCIKKDFKAHQYFSSANQFICDSKSVNRPMCRGTNYMAYRASHSTECCTGNVMRFLPNYIARMWLRDKQNNPVAAFYGPSMLTTEINGQKVVITEKTSYPFSDVIDFNIDAAQETQFTLHLRIPYWCFKAELMVNGEKVNVDLERGTFFKLDRMFKKGDVVTLKLPANLELDYRDRGGVAVKRGSLVFSMPIKEQWKSLPVDEHSTEAFPHWEVYPAGDWNYASNVNEENIWGLTVKYNEVGDDPWASDKPAMEIEVPARKVRDWNLTVNDKVLVPKDPYVQRDKRQYSTWDWGPFKSTPPLPDPYTLENRLEPPVESIKLVPYGCTHLRMTVLPYRGLLTPYVP